MQISKFLSVDDANAVVANTKYILMWGHIEYEDIFPDTSLHHYDWCVAVIPNDIARAIFSFPILKNESD